jgi:DNA-binding response OmpR family regulator
MSGSNLTRIEPAGPVRYCLVCDDRTIEAAVRVGCPPPHEISGFSIEGIVDEHLNLSEQGRRIVACARSAEAVLVEWRFEMAPVINTLCFHVRRELLAPMIALCRSTEEIMAAVAAGADYALTFPIVPSLLYARTFAYRRLTDAVRQVTFESVIPQNGAASLGRRELLHFGALSLDRAAHRFYIREKEVELTPREFALVEFLIEHNDTLLTRNDILDRVWGITFDTGTNMVDVYMFFLRRKLEAHGIKGMIQTVRGKGYRLVLPESAAA